MSAHLYITDVGPRDGLQSQKSQVDTAGKRALIQALWAAGVRSIEATSFVSPKAVPQMADAHEVLQNLPMPADGRLSALVPNPRGLDRALAAGVREIATVLAATETMNAKNIRMGLAEAAHTCQETLALAQQAGVRTRAYVAVAFECPFEGPTPADQVVRLAQQLFEAGAGEIVIADTIGAAAPQDVDALFKRLIQVIPVESLGVHLHDTRGMALANAWAAMGHGVRRFDSSIGGLGGCPFAPGAAGNLATEDLVLMAQQCGFSTGIDLTALLAAVDLAGALVGYAVGGRSARWLRGRLAKEVPSTASASPTTCQMPMLSRSHSAATSVPKIGSQ